MRAMYLTDVEEFESQDERGQAIQYMKRENLPIPQILHLFAFKPERTRYLSLYTQAVMRGESPLSPGQRELIAAFTSRRNECPF
jgi:hypothetical protein